MCEAQFDKLKRRGKALDMSWIAHDRVYSIRETAGTVTQQIFRTGRARIIVDATLGKPIGEAGSRAIAHREWAVHDDTRPSSTHRLWRANLASSAVSRIRCRSHRARARRLKDLPKNCHLLPSTAILPPHNCYDRFNRSNSFLAPQGRAGRPRPGAVNRERGRRHVRNAKPAPPTCTAKAPRRRQGHASQAARGRAFPAKQHYERSPSSPILSLVVPVSCRDFCSGGRKMPCANIHKIKFWKDC